eukprot:7896585-Karenia_brevis.AAC.1
MKSTPRGGSQHKTQKSPPPGAPPEISNPAPGVIFNIGPKIRPPQGAPSEILNPPPGVEFKTG